MFKLNPRQKMLIGNDSLEYAEDTISIKFNQLSVVAFFTCCTEKKT